MKKLALCAALSITLTGCADARMSADEFFGKFRTHSVRVEDNAEMYEAEGYDRLGDMDRLSAQMSNEDIYIYSLDQQDDMNQGGSASYGGSEVPMGAASQGVPYSGDPSVMIFPLDGGVAPQLPPQQMHLAPPVSSRPAYQSPFPAGGMHMQGTSPLIPPQNYYQQPQPSQSYYQPPAVTQSSGQVLAMDGPAARIYFGHGSANVNETGKKVINIVSQDYKRSPYGTLSVEGHASSRAESANPVDRQIANLRMSLKRSENVTKGLIQSGVPSSSIKTTAYGDAHPSAPIPGYSQESASRRVEIRKVSR